MKDSGERGDEGVSKGFRAGTSSLTQICKEITISLSTAPAHSFSGNLAKILHVINGSTELKMSAALPPYLQCLERSGEKQVEGKLNIYRWKKVFIITNFETFRNHCFLQKFRNSCFCETPTSGNRRSSLLQMGSPLLKPSSVLCRQTSQDHHQGHRHPCHRTPEV